MTTSTQASDEGRVFANAGWLVLSQIVTWSIASVQAVIVPRYFGAETAGHLHLSLSLWAIAGLFVSFGTDITLSRRIARGDRDLDVLLGSVLAVRIGFHLIAFVAVLLFTVAVGYSGPVLAAVTIFGVAQLLYQSSGVFDTALYGMEHMRVTSMIAVVLRFARTGLLVALVVAGFAFEQAILASIFGGVLAVVLRYRALRRVHPVRLRFERGVARDLLSESRAIFVNRLARNLYVQLDVIVVSLLVSDTVVGWYAAGDILFGTLLFVPNIVGAALFPAITRLHLHDPEAGVAVTRRSFNLLMALVIPLGFGVAAIAHQTIELIYGSGFIESGDVFMVFGPVIALTSLNTLLSQQLIARDGERALTRLMVLALAVAIPVDIALIEWTQSAWGNGAIGAAMAYLVTEALMLAGAIKLLPKRTLDRHTAALAARVVLASLIMFGVVWTVRGQFLLIPIGVGLAVYSALVLPLRLVGREDLRFLRSLRGSNNPEMAP